jgi:DNA polymerase-3 subunit epsilon
VERPLSPVVVESTASPLVDRAKAFLADGPAGPVPLIEHVCRLPGAPPAVAERMALALFTGIAGVARDDSGRWSLVRETPSTTYGEPGVVRPLRAVSFAVADVETTGSSPVGGDRITEFCAVIVKGREVVDSFETLVNPLRPIPENVTALTRITWNMVREAPTFVDVAPRVAELLLGHVFVAHNATFDWRFVSKELAQSGCLVSGERLCTVKLARAVLPAVRRRSLDALTFHYGIENHARHRAGGDALATARVFLRLLDAAQDRGCENLDDLRTLMKRPPSRRRGRRRQGMPVWSDGEITA